MHVILDSNKALLFHNLCLPNEPTTKYFKILEYLKSNKRVQLHIRNERMGHLSNGKSQQYVDVIARGHIVIESRQIDSLR